MGPTYPPRATSEQFDFFRLLGTFRVGLERASWSRAPYRRPSAKTRFGIYILEIITLGLIRGRGLRLLGNPRGYGA